MRKKGMNQFFTATVLFILALSTARAEKSVRAESILLEDKIAATSSHYKSVLTELADLQTRAAITEDKAERQQIKPRIHTLQAESETVRDNIESLVKDFNALRRKSGAPKSSLMNGNLLLAECQLAATSSHHKTLLTQLAEKQSPPSRQILIEENAATERAIEQFAKKIDSLSRK